MNVKESFETKEKAYEYLRSVHVGEQLRWLVMFLFELKEDLATHGHARDDKEIKKK
jgi:hypothetical protein